MRAKVNIESIAGCIRTHKNERGRAAADRIQDSHPTVLETRKKIAVCGRKINRAPESIVVWSI